MSPSRTVPAELVEEQKETIDHRINSWGAFLGWSVCVTRNFSYYLECLIGNDDLLEARKLWLFHGN